MAMIRIDGQHSWIAARWVFRYVLTNIGRSEVSSALVDRVIESLEHELNYLNLSDLSRRDREVFARCVARSADDLVQAGPNSIADPSFYTGLVDSVRELQAALEASLTVSHKA